MSEKPGIFCAQNGQKIVGFRTAWGGGEVYIMSGKLFYINNNSTEDNIEKRQDFLVQAEAIVIGAGAGLSASAGFTYKGGTLS